jgi:hypothetical protein
MPVLMQDSAEAVVSSDVELDAPGLLGDRVRRREQWCRQMKRPMRPVVL